MFAHITEFLRREFRCLFLDKFECLLLVLMLERQHFCDHEIKHDSKSPHIDWEIVGSFLQNLRSHIRWCSTAVNDLVTWCYNLREAKIRYFDVFQFWRGFLPWDSLFHFDENVFRFDISMHNSACVEVAKSFKGLFYDFGDLKLCQVVLVQIIVELATLDRLHWDEDPTLGLIDISNLDNVWVSNHADDL